MLAPCIVRTFEKTLTDVDIIKFTDKDEMKYLIVEHSSGKYFGFILRESDERTSAISIVQDKDEFMFMGWKVAKVIPTWVLGFVGWNNLMMSYNATPSQGIEMVNTNDILNADNVNVGNDDEVNWSEKKIEDAKIKTADPLYVGDGRGRTNVGISTSKETKYSQQRVQNIQTLNSYVENITRARCGHLKIPKHVEST